VKHEQINKYWIWVLKTRNREEKRKEKKRKESKYGWCRRWKTHFQHRHRHWY